MLRSAPFRSRPICRIVNSVLFQPAAAISGSSGVATAPSAKTTVLLRKLPHNVTETSLKASLETVPLRKVELQPGFTIHLKNPAAATKLARILQDKFQCKSKIESSLMPSLLLSNIPHNIQSVTLMEAFSSFKPVSVNITGSSSLQILVETSDIALSVADIVESIQVDEKFLQTNIVELNKDTFVIQIRDTSNEKMRIQTEAEIKSKLPSSILESCKFIHETKQAMTANVRLHKNVNTGNVRKALNEVKIHGKSLVLSDLTPSSNPALFIRNTDGLTKDQITTLLRKLNPTRIGISNRSEHVLNDLVVAYFDSSSDAQSALRTLKGATYEGKRLSVVYKEVNEPELVLTNILKSINIQELKERLKTHQVVNVTSTLRPSPATTTEETVNATHDGELRILFANLHAMELAEQLLQSYKMTIERGGYSPYSGFTVQVPAGVDVAEEELLSMIQKAIPSKELSNPNHAQVSITSNRQAFVNFLTKESAFNARKAIDNGTISVPSINLQSNRIHSKLSSQSSSVVEVFDFNPEIPFSEVMKHMEENQSNSSQITKSFLAADRVAIAKFRRHMHVVPGMKKLKAITIDGAKLGVERYYANTYEAKSEYDRTSAEDEFDRMTLRTLLTDYMSSDPAMRFQIAKNMFERTLSDIKTSKELTDSASYLLANTSNLGLKKEAEKLLKKPTLTAADKHKLFELYIQRDDMLAFFEDYQDFAAAYGAPDESDPYDWSKFDMSQDEDVGRLLDALKQREKDLEINPYLVNKKVKVQDYMKPSDADLDEEDELDEQSSIVRDELEAKFDDENTTFGNEEVQEKDKKSKNNLSDESMQFIDPDGRVWSGIIVDQDTVQKTLPGQRVISYRALVVIGNGRGVGGFGTGKAKAPNAAVAAAFRDALRNITVIDLYENSCLAHDLYGKHNSCKVYIRATPRDRILVAGDLVEAILTHIGITSASVKVAGRRNPYSVVRAIFDALKKHENLDEYAKDRGQRYLTLKWLQKNNI